MSDQQKWDQHYQADLAVRIQAPSVAPVLVQNQHLLPCQGKALELACGLGDNAIFLAERGLLVSAWDLSAVAVQRLAARAASASLALTTECKDVVAAPPMPDQFDVVVVSCFLDRRLIAPIRNTIKAGGLVFYQTFIKEAVTQTGPRNLAYRLDNNELLDFFKGWQILFYREEGITGDVSLGYRDQAMLVAKKPVC